MGGGGGGGWGLKPRNWLLKIGVMCLLDLFREVGGVSAPATIAKFLEPFYGLY